MQGKTHWLMLLGKTDLLSYSMCQMIFSKILHWQGALVPVAGALPQCKPCHGVIMVSSLWCCTHGIDPGICTGPFGQHEWCCVMAWCLLLGFSTNVRHVVILCVAVSYKWFATTVPGMLYMGGVDMVSAIWVLDIGSRVLSCPGPSCVVLWHPSSEVSVNVSLSHSGACLPTK